MNGGEQGRNIESFKENLSGRIAVGTRVERRFGQKNGVLIDH